MPTTEIEGARQVQPPPDQRRPWPFSHSRGAPLFSVGVLCSTPHEVGRPTGASRARRRRQVHDSCVGHSAGPADLCELEKALETVRGRAGRLSGLSDFHSKSIFYFYGALVWARRVLNSQGRRFPARAVHRDGDGRHGRGRYRGPLREPLHPGYAALPGEALRSTRVPATGLPFAKDPPGLVLAPPGPRGHDGPRRRHDALPDRAVVHLLRRPGEWRQRDIRWPSCSHTTYPAAG
jgi:hypothetical protein